MLQRTSPKQLGDWATQVGEPPIPPRGVLQLGAFPVFPGEPWTGRATARRVLPLWTPLPLASGDIGVTALFVAHHGATSSGEGVERAEATRASTALASMRLTTEFDIPIALARLSSVSVRELVGTAGRATVLHPSTPDSGSDQGNLRYASAIGGLVGKCQSTFAARVLSDASGQIEIASDVAVCARRAGASEDVYVIGELCLRLVPKAKRVFVTITRDPEDGTTGLHFRVRTSAPIDVVVAAEDGLHEAFFERIPGARRSLFSIGYDFIH